VKSFGVAVAGTGFIGPVHVEGLRRAGQNVDSKITLLSKYLGHVNVTGTFLCCRAAVPFLRRAQAGGRIVTFSSTAGLRGYPNRVGYSASKWAIRGLTRALARELGPLDITVNSVAPYTVHGSRMADVVEGKAARQRMTPEQVYADFTKQTALGRWIDESDVAETIRFLVSDGARNITGQNIAIDAGWNA